MNDQKHPSETAEEYYSDLESTESADAPRAWSRGQRLGAPLQKGQVFRADTAFLPRYEIVSDGPIGQGAMGRVYRAVDHALRREVAIKECIISADHPRVEELAERFRNEALVAARISHPCILEPYDQGYYEERAWYAMQWLRGAHSLADVIYDAAERGEQPPIDDGIFFFRQIASALRVAHELGVWHRDIKPSNIMVVPLIGGGWSLKLIDWGIAHDPDAKLTDLGVSLGTPAYMAPECFASDFEVFPPRLVTVDHRIDLFSFGATFYEYFAGAHPHPQILEPPEKKQNLPRARIAAEVYRDPDTYPPPLGHRRPGLPDWVEPVIHRLLERQPEDRYQHADEVVRDSDNQRERPLAPYNPASRAKRVRGVDTVAARPKAAKPPRRRWRWLAAAAVLGLVALLAYAAGRWLQQPGAPELAEPQKPPTSQQPLAAEPAGGPQGTQSPAVADTPPPGKPRKKPVRNQRRRPAEPTPQDDPWPAFLIDGNGN